MKNNHETDVANVRIAHEENYELVIRNFNSIVKTNKEKELEKIIAFITKDELIDLKKLNYLKFIKESFENRTDEFHILTLLLNFSEKCFDCILEEVCENLAEKTVDIFTEFNSCPETIEDFNSIIYDDLGILSQEREIIEVAINFEIIDRQKLYQTTKNTLENAMLLANVEKLIKQ